MVYNFLCFLSIIGGFWDVIKNGNLIFCSFLVFCVCRILFFLFLFINFVVIDIGLEFIMFFILFL